MFGLGGLAWRMVRGCSEYARLLKLAASNTERQGGSAFNRSEEREDKKEQPGGRGVAKK